MKCRNCKHKPDCGKVSHEVFGFDSFTEVDSYEAFLKSEEAKIERGEGQYCGENIIYVVDDENKVNDVLNHITKDSNPNLYAIMHELLENGCRLVEYEKHGEWKFIGVSIEVDDYYYIISNGEEKAYLTCVGKLNFKRI